MAKRFPTIALLATALLAAAGGCQRPSASSAYVPPTFDAPRGRPGRRVRRSRL